MNFPLLLSFYDHFILWSWNFLSTDPLNQFIFMDRQPPTEQAEDERRFQEKTQNCCWVMCARLRQRLLAATENTTLAKVGRYTPVFSLHKAGNGSLVQSDVYSVHLLNTMCILYPYIVYIICIQHFFFLIFSKCSRSLIELNPFQSLPDEIVLFTFIRISPHRKLCSTKFPS